MRVWRGRAACWLRQRRTGLSLERRNSAFLCTKAPIGGEVFGTITDDEMRDAALRKVREIFSTMPKDWNARIGSDLKQLPYVNRLDQLMEGAEALLDTQQAASTSGSDTRKLYLAFCAQLFGAGKSSYAYRLAMGLQVLYGGPSKFCYVCVDGVSSDYATKSEAIASILWHAGSKAKVLSHADSGDKSDLLRLCDLLQTRLAENEKSGQGVSQLFLHMDEFNLGDDLLDRYFPPGRPLVKRYHDVWKECLWPILKCPNIHLIVTGKPIELALIGHGESGDSPTSAYHAVLGTLKEEHIREILQHLNVSGPGIDPDTALSLFRVNEDGGDAAVKCLQQLTGGVPRFLCSAISELLKLRSKGPLTGTAASISAQICDSVLEDSYVINGITPMMRALQGENQDYALEFLDLLQAAGSNATYKKRSDEATYMQTLCDRFGAYLDLAEDNCIKVVVPKILSIGLAKKWESKPNRTLNLASLLKSENRVAGSPKEQGQRFESLFRTALEYYWSLSSKKGVHSSLQKLFGSHIKTTMFEKPLVPLHMRKFMSPGETPQCVNIATPRLLHYERISTQNLSLMFNNGSYSCDMGYSLIDGALFAFALKNYSEPPSKALFKEDVGKFGAMIASLGEEEKNFYKDRVLFFISYPAGTNYLGGQAVYASGNQNGSCSSFKKTKRGTGRNWFKVIEVSEDATKEFLNIPDEHSAIGIMLRKSMEQR